MKRLFGKFASILVACLLGCVFLEAGANFWLWHAAGEKSFERYASLDQLQRANPDKLAYLLRLTFGLYPNPRYQKAPNRHNSLGFRGDEIVLPKPAGEFRIACLGGSTTYDEEIKDYHQAYPYVLEQELRRRGYNVSVVNAGTPGWSSRETLLNFALRVGYLDVDLAVLADGINDFLFRGVWPPEKFRSDYIVTEGPFPAFLTPRLLDYFTFPRILRTKLGAVLPAQMLDNGRDPDTWGVNVILFLVQHQNGTYPDGVFKEVSLREILAKNPPTYFENNLRSLLTLTRGKQVQPLLATSPVNAGWMRHELGPEVVQFLDGMEEMNAAIRRVGVEQAAPVFDFASQIPEKSDLWADYIHNNEQGAALKAQLLAEFIEKSGLIPATSRTRR